MADGIGEGIRRMILEASVHQVAEEISKDPRMDWEEIAALIACNGGYSLSVREAKELIGEHAPNCVMARNKGEGREL